MGAELPMLPMLLPITPDPRSRATSAAAGAGSSEYMEPGMFDAYESTCPAARRDCQQGQGRDTDWILKSAVSNFTDKTCLVGCLMCFIVRILK